MAHQLQKQRDFQQILWFSCDLEREREYQKSPLTTRVWNSPGQRGTQDLGHGSTWDSRGTRGTRGTCGVKGLDGIAVELSAASWHLVALQAQDVTLFSSTASTAWSVSSVSSASTASTASCTINTSLSVCAWVWECVLILWVCCRLLESHVGTHVSHVQHIVRSLAFLPWRWPGTWHVLEPWHFHGSRVRRGRKAEGWLVGDFLKRAPPLIIPYGPVTAPYGLVESNLPFSYWWNSQMIYEWCMNDCVLLSSGFCDSSSKCSTCRRTIESFKIPNNIHTYDLIGMCFCLSIPYCLSCSNSATVFQLKRLSTCDCNNGWLWFQT